MMSSLPVASGASLGYQGVLERIRSIESTLGLQGPQTPLATPESASEATSPFQTAFQQMLQSTKTTPPTSPFDAEYDPNLDSQSDVAGMRVNAFPSPKKQAGQGSHFEGLIEKYAEKNGLAPSLVEAVIKAESAYNPTAKSPVGALGLMQLMPSTAQGLGVKNPLNPEENIAGGSKYLASLIKRFDGDTSLAVAAYNAGPNAVEKYHGVPPYKETQNYVKKVLQYEANFAQAYDD